MRTKTVIYTATLLFGREYVAGKNQVRQLQQQLGLPLGVSVCERSVINDINATTRPSFRSANADGYHGVSIFRGIEHAYCMNDGFCKSNYQDDIDNPCNCLNGFEGPHCEFAAGTLPTNCTKKCDNGGECKIGAPSWNDAFHEDFYKVSPSDMQFCLCKPEFFGNSCEYSVDNFNNMSCGSDPSTAKQCYHGGICVKTFSSNFTAQYHCDCTTANLDGIERAGTYCEYEATTTCADDHNGKQFCVNGGTCKGESHLGCTCPAGFVGPICEFQDLEIEPPQCKLQCMNDGVCRKGAKDIAIIENLQVVHDSNGSMLSPEVTKSYNEDFEHCVCPMGYIGLQCQHKLDICPGGDHGCLNGGDCRTTMQDGHLRFECDCVGAVSTSTGVRYAGEYCEMQSTSFCTPEGKMALSGPAVTAFCTNGGSCKKVVSFTEQHAGCDCPLGFYGDNCQYLVPHSNNLIDKNKGSNRAVILISLFSSLTFFFIIIALVLLYRRTHLKQTNGTSNFGNLDLYESQFSPPKAGGMDLISFVSDEDYHGKVLFDDNSYASSKGSHSTNCSSKRRTTKRLKKLKKKKFSTMDRSIIDLTAGGDTVSINDDSTNRIRNNDSSSINSDRDGSLQRSARSITGSTIVTSPPSKVAHYWPNSTRNPTDTASIFNEIDLGDDYGVNLIT